MHVPPIKHAYVINFGAMLAAWTRNEVKATVHRVVNLSTQERYSSPYFMRPALTTVLDPAVWDHCSGERLKTAGEDEGDDVKTCEEILAGYYTRTGQLAAKS